MVDNSKNKNKKAHKKSNQKKKEKKAIPLKKEWKEREKVYRQGIEGGVFQVGALRGQGEVPMEPAEEQRQQ